MRATVVDMCASLKDGREREREMGALGCVGVFLPRNRGTAVVGLSCWALLGGFGRLAKLVECKGVVSGGTAVVAL